MQCLNYDPDTGEFTWKMRASGPKWWNTRFAGRAAGKACGKGYLQVNVKGEHYLLHRLAWAIMSGYFPDVQVDHIDGDKANNSWSNLRLASSQQNAWNRGKNSNNSSGYKGVRQRRNGRFEAYIKVSGKYICLGVFDNADQAANAHRNASLSMHGEFSYFAERGAA